MPDYESLKQLCEKSSSISTEVIDKFLLHYAAAKNNLDKEFNKHLLPFRHVVSGMPTNWRGLIAAQYIAHRIFKVDGLIHKYLNHAEIKRLSTEALDFLKQQSQTPWRFRFSRIVGNPAKDFYEMEDILTETTFLLYSKSVGLELATRPVLSWFNLVEFNGACWQTFGPVIGFQCFDQDDIFFYATEYNNSIEDPDGLEVELEKNPVPFMMLATGANYPRIESRGFEIVFVSGTSHLTDFNISNLKKVFKTEYADGALKLTHKIWSEPPHFAEAYLNESEQAIVLMAKTDHGYEEMQKLLAKANLHVAEEPEVRIHPPLLNVIQQILKRDIEVNPYEDLFSEETSPASDEITQKLNDLLALALPQINAGQKPDIEKLAMKVGVDPAMAKSMIKEAMATVKGMLTQKTE